MQQVLFRVFGVPVYGFGFMMVIALYVSVWQAGRRAQKEGIAQETIWDLAIWLFFAGIAGARIVYMIQYGIPFWDFFKIWQGGLVFYGSAIGGVVGYFLGYHFVFRKRGVSSWQLADIVAPSVALGLCIGRFGCLLNGCCFGNVACSDCLAISFPVGAPPRYALVKEGYQTAAGFTLANQKEPDDPRSVVGAVAEGSPAANSDLRPGDLILKVNGESNRAIIEIRGKAEALQALAGALTGAERTVLQADQNYEIVQFQFAQLHDYQQALPKIQRAPVLVKGTYDTLWDVLVHRWPRGRDDLHLSVRHADGKVEDLSPFGHRTLGLHPTQIYESISMLLLFVLLTAFYPFRPRVGSVMVVLMLCYAVHRFLNEMLRNDTDPVGFDMTLSQNGSVIVLLAGLAMGAWLWWKGTRPQAAPAPA